MAEAGATPAQEIAFTLANGIEYVRAALAAGLAVDDFAPRLSFFFVARTTLLEEVAKFRAARRIWARLMRDEFGAKDPKSLMLRFHTQTAGVQLTAQQPEVNLVRVAVQGARRGARRHPVAAHQLLRRGDRAAHREGRPAGPAHPAGARVRDRPDRHRRPVRRLVRGRGDDRRGRGGGARADAAGRGPRRRGGARSRTASRSARSSAARTGSRSEIDSGERVVVGVNRFTLRRGGAVRAAAGRPGDRGSSRPSGWRGCAPSATRAAVDAALAALREAAEGTDNVLYPMREALRARATVGEVCDALREVWGTYVPTDAF